MSDASGSSWWSRGTALALGDLRKDAFVRDSRIRAVGRLVALLIAVTVVIVLAVFSLGEEPSVRSRTYTYRVINVAKLPTGHRNLGTYCPCSHEPLLWNAFVAWPRFPTSKNRQAVAAYCVQLRNITGTASLADQAPVTATPPSSPPAAPTPRLSGRRHLHQAFNATTAAAVRNSVLQQACAAWVQDVVVSLDAANLALQPEAYPGAQLRPLASVQAGLRLWLASRLKNHLQAQYRVAAAVFGAGAGYPLPESFGEMLQTETAVLDNMMNSVYTDVLPNLDYSRYVALCKPGHCDVTATMPRHAYVINGIALVGGLCALMLLTTAVVWRLAVLLPFLRERDAAYTDFK